MGIIIKTDKLNNDGFSLVEIIVAVAILSIISLPIMKSFATTSITTSRAQSIQNATSVAEKYIEIVKTTPYENIVNEVDSWTKKSDTYCKRFGGVTATSGEVFDVYADVSEIGYDYSEGMSDVSDINNVSLPELYSVDSDEHIVISWEINNYDAAAVANLAYKANKSEENIKNDGKKITKVILSGGGESKITAKCDVVYEIGDTQLTYTVFNKTVNDIPIEKGKKSSGGPHLYIFYTLSQHIKSDSYFSNEYIDIEDNTIENTSDPNKKYKQDYYVILQKTASGATYANPVITVHGTAVKPEEKPLGDELNSSDDKYMKKTVGDAPVWQSPDSIENYNSWCVNTDSNSRLYTNLNSSTGNIRASLYETKQKDRLFNVKITVYKAGVYSETSWPTDGDGKKMYAELNSTMRVQ